jgi:hypothetical protein
MMEALARRLEDIAKARQRETARAVANQLRTLLGGSLIEVDEMRVIVSGKGLVKRWLIDPALRFLSGGTK